MVMEIVLLFMNEWVWKFVMVMEVNMYCSVLWRIFKILFVIEVEKLFIVVVWVLKWEKILVRVRGDGDDDFDEVVVVGDIYG